VLLVQFSIAEVVTADHVFAEEYCWSSKASV